EVYDQAAAVGSGYARHELALAQLVFLAEPVIAVVQFAVDFQYFGFAVTAGTAAAQVGQLVAGLFGGFEHRLVRRHLDGHALAGQGDAERLAAGALLDEALVVDVAVGPAQGVGAGDGIVDHAVRAADVDV